MMGWVHIFMTLLFAFNVSHQLVLNKMIQDIQNVQLNISSQNKSLTTIFEHLDIMGGIVSDNFGYIKFVKNQTDAIHLRMAAYENN
tara:strand:- start:651 stop:908 length:258 start_codon:yes stop_codon:yes gene_type:complete